MESSLVVDIGSASTKVGWSGEDTPTSVFPTVSECTYAKYTESVESPLYSPEAVKDGEKPGTLMHRGIVQDWDGMEKYWQTVLNEVSVSQTNAEKTPILLVDSPSSSISDRVRWAEILFEGYRAPSLCIGNSASLSIFAAGRTTGVVVDCGAGVTTSVPVFEGLALTHACTSMDYGGMDVTLRLQKLLKERAGCTINLSDALILKERMAHVNSVAPIPLGKLKGRITKNVADAALQQMTAADDDMTTVNLPDGKEVKIETRFFSDCAEQLIANDVTTFNGLSKMVCESLVLCDDSIRGDLMNNIIIAGGTSMLPGLGTRLAKDLNPLLQASSTEEGSDPPSAVVTPSADHRESGFTHQRKHAAWIGGSIFASFDSFKQLRVTKQEWEESAEAALLTKCF